MEDCEAFTQNERHMKYYVSETFLNSNCYLQIRSKGEWVIWSFNGKGKASANVGIESFGEWP